MSTRCVLELFPDPSIKADIRLVGTPGQPRVSRVDFEVRWQTTVKDVEMYVPTCWSYAVRWRSFTAWLDNPLITLSQLVTIPQLPPCIVTRLDERFSAWVLAQVKVLDFFKLTTKRFI